MATPVGPHVIRFECGLYDSAAMFYQSDHLKSNMHRCRHIDLDSLPDEYFKWVRSSIGGQ
jgi:hypothetical protein